MSAHPRHIPDSECKQGKCGATTTRCWGECCLRRFVISNTSVAPERFYKGISGMPDGVAATPPAPTPAAAEGQADEVGKAELWDAINEHVHASEDMMRDLPRHGANNRWVEAQKELKVVIDSIFAAPLPRQAAVRGEWISVADRLPEEAETVLAGYVKEDGGGRLDFAWQASDLWSPNEPWTHWMRLTAIPTVKASQ